MKHYIIVKFRKDAPSLDQMMDEIDSIFKGVLEVPGVSGYNLVRNCIDRSNRYDLMIIIEMKKESLESYDDCHSHHQWKENFSQYIESKAIFDCE